MRLTICLFLLLTFSLSNAQEVNIIPKPVELKISDSKEPFIINNQTKIVFSHGASLEKYADRLNEYIQKYHGFKLRLYGHLDTNIHRNYIEIGINPYPQKPDIQGKYRLDVSKDKINIGSTNSAGIFYAIQTLVQLFPTQNQKSKIKNPQIQIPQLTITDYPRFAYRGMHLDVGRHFFPVDFIKKYIDYLALHKFNTFHWHLTEDQGWRIEIKKYPKLTSVGGWRNGTIIGRYPGTGNDGIKYGGFYTQEQIKEIVKYASDRYITVIPEIEMPGHSSAAIAAYPELSCFPDEPTINYFPKQCKWNGDTTGKQVQQTWGVFDDVFCAGQEKTFSFLEDVMDEVLALFPSKYVHVGGDECPKENWKHCPHCQKRIKDNNLKDEHELQSYFIQRMEKYLNGKGKTLIGWDEILEGGLAPNAVVMSWRGEKGGIEAAQQNHDVIMTPGNPVYFDHTQSENEDSVTIGGYNPIEKVYAYEPVPKELTAEQAKHVLGAQANMWTEYMKNTSKVEYMLFPRISALSEVLWSKKENRNWDDFQKRLMTQFKRYDLWKTNYSKAYFDLKTKVSPTKNFNGVIWEITSKIICKDCHINVEKEIMKAGQLVTKDLSGLNDVSVLISESCKIKTYQRTHRSLGPTLEQQFHFSKATGKKISLATEASKTYPGDGAFTLVNGVINEKGFARTKEFLGFNGTDCEAMIDLGESKEISFVVVNCLDRRSSWIWRPQSAEVLGSGDGQTWYPLKSTDNFQENKTATGKGMMTMSFRKTFARYVKVLVKNWGVIPPGNPGAGNKAWLFVDEIEVDAPNP